jgi:lipoprotein-releasing system ATP-binding protein
MDSTIILQAENLRKSYSEGSERLDVLQGVTLSLKKGEIVALVGESGSGKTTLLNLLGSLDRPDQGTIQFNGTSVTGLKGNELAAFRNRHIGFLFQFHYLLSDFTAIENVIIPGLIAGKDREQLVKKGIELLERMGLGTRLDHCPAELSGGEQQRVAAVRAIINDPLVVLADEPAGNLDEKNSARLIDLIFSIRQERGQTFFIATHSGALARRCDRILYLRNGTTGDTP